MTGTNISASLLNNGKLYSLLLILLWGPVVSQQLNIEILGTKAFTDGRSRDAPFGIILNPTTRWSTNPTTGDLHAWDMATNVVRTKPYGKSYQLNFCQGQTYVLDTNGKFLTFNSELLIGEFLPNVKERRIYNLKKTIIKYCRARGLKAPMMRFTGPFMKVVNQKAYFGLGDNYEDDIYVNNSHFNGPLYGTFDLKTKKYEVFGHWSDTPKKGLRQVSIGSLASHNPKSNITYVSVSNSHNLQAFNATGKLLFQSNVPDSIKRKYTMYDRASMLQQDSIPYLTKLNTIGKGFYFRYLNYVIRLNDSLIASALGNHFKYRYLIFNNQLAYLGEYNPDSTIVGMSGYINQDSTFFLNKLIDYPEGYRLTKVRFTVKPNTFNQDIERRTKQ